MTKTPFVLACLLLLPGLSAAREERRPQRDADREVEKEAFLGIATGPVHESLRAQLGIDRGVGLIVHHVHSDSPAAEQLETHDILTKINDQILVNQDQLAVLVRNAGIGTNVNVTYMRRGAEQTASVTLGEREVREMRPLFQFGDGRGFHPEDIDRHMDRAQRGIHDALERVQREMAEARERAEEERRDREERERQERGPRDSNDERDRERDGRGDQNAPERKPQPRDETPRGEVL
ncbi:MAG: S1C family serine protease [Verrucomicrobiota bacterium]